MMKSAHPIGDMDLHGRVIDRLGIGAEDGQFQRAGASAAVDGWSLRSRRVLSRRIGMSLSAREERDQNKTKDTYSSVHSEQLYVEEFAPDRNKPLSGGLMLTV